MGHRVTLEDIARASNASVAAVSLALRNKPGVSRERRERILSAAIALGYKRGVAIASPSLNQGRTISLLIRSSTAVPALDRFYTWVVTGVQDALSEKGMTLVLGALSWDVPAADQSVVPAHLCKQHSDGWLVVGSYPREYVRRIVDRAYNEGVPVVLVDDIDYAVDVDQVGTANRRGARMATQHLLDHGHRAIAFVGLVHQDVPNFDERYEGYADAMRAVGLEPRLIHTDDERERIAAWNQEFPEVTGLVAANDWDAARTVRALVKAGVRVPDDVSIVGFDDTDHASDCLPELTTIRVDKMSLGRLAVGLLEYRWAWPDSASVRTVVDVQLIERDSVCAVNRI